MDEEKDSPVANGLIALVSVALVVGLLAAIIVLLGTRLLGVTGGDGSADGAGVGDSLSLPPLQPTELDSGLLITLAPSPSASASDDEAPLGIGESATPVAEAMPTESEEPRQVGDRKIILSAAGNDMKVGDELMLSGTYRGGEGAVLGIFYNVNGEGWEEFNVDTNVYGGVFQVFVSTYKTGTVEWRVEDPANGNQSNAVRVHYED